MFQISGIIVDKVGRDFSGNLEIAHNLKTERNFFCDFDLIPSSRGWILGKAPGKSLHKEISLKKLFQMFPDDATLEELFAEQCWPDGAYCPHCDLVNVQPGAKHKSMPYRYRERDCRKRFSVCTGMSMECSNLGYQIWAIATYLMTTSLKGISSMLILRLHRMARASAHACAKRLKY